MTRNDEYLAKNEIWKTGTRVLITRTEMDPLDHVGRKMTTKWVVVKAYPNLVLFDRSDKKYHESFTRAELKQMLRNGTLEIL